MDSYGKLKGELKLLSTYYIYVYGIVTTYSLLQTYISCNYSTGLICKEISSEEAAIIIYRKIIGIMPSCDILPVISNILNQRNRDIYTCRRKLNFTASS